MVEGSIWSHSGEFCAAEARMQVLYITYKMLCILHNVFNIWHLCRRPDKKVTYICPPQQTRRTSEKVKNNGQAKNNGKEASGSGKSTDDRGCCIKTMNQCCII